MIPYNKNLVQNARELRKNMTPEEKHLWYDFLKKLPLTVKRQHNIENYIVDFYIASKKIAIEIDGGQHYTPENKAEDERRDTLLATWGINVLRYARGDVCAPNLVVYNHFFEVDDHILHNAAISYLRIAGVENVFLR